MKSSTSRSEFTLLTWLIKPFGVALLCTVLMGGTNAYYLLGEGAKDRPLMEVEKTSLAAEGSVVNLTHEDTLNATRLNKIAYLWDLHPNVVGVYVTLLHLFLFGGILLGLSRHQGYLSLPLVAMIGLIVVIVPPFQAPDEPDHFLSYLKHIKAPSTHLQETKEFAKRIHFERIKFRPDQKFTTRDMIRDYPEHWASHVQPTTTKTRSFMTAGLWDAVSPWLQHLSTGHQLLALRGINGLCFSLVVIICSLYANIRLTYLVGSIPFFVFLGSIVSDYSLLPSFLLIILGILSRIAEPQSQHTSPKLILFLLGFMVSQVFYEPRSLFLLPPTIFAVVTFLFINQRVRDVFPAWFTISLGCFGHWLMMLAVGAGQSSLSTKSLDHITWLSPQFLPVVSAIVMCVCFGIVHQLLLTAPGVQKPATQLTKWFWCWCVGTLLISLIINVPQVQNIEIKDPPSLWQYSKNLFSVVATWWRLDRMDFYLQSSLLVGFGWLAHLPNWLAGLVNLWVLVSLPFMFPHQKREVQGASVVGILLLGLMVLIGLAYGALATKQNLHGRYILAYFVVGLVPLAYWLSVAGLPNPIIGRYREKGRSLQSVSALQSLGFTAIHSFAFAWVWGRYF